MVFRTVLLKRFALPILAVLGLGLGLYFAAVLANPSEPPPQQLGLPPESPYTHTVSGSGLVEANTRNIALGVPTGGLVSDVRVTEGDEVAAGDVLVRLDDRALQADRAVQEQNVALVGAQRTEAEVHRADAYDQLHRAERLKAGLSVSEDRLARLRFSAQSADTALASMKAQQALAEARLAAAQVAINERLITAPVAGRILKVNVTLGAYIAPQTNTAALVLGNDDPLYVRVSVDENDLWRLQPGAKATGALRSHAAIGFPLTFVRIEPYVIPKTSLTGSLSERVDTRTMDVLFKVEPSPDGRAWPLYIGQQVDVFIHAPKT